MPLLVIRELPLLSIAVWNWNDMALSEKCLVVVHGLLVVAGHGHPARAPVSSYKTQH
jgi:hypothetical protein